MIQAERRFEMQDNFSFTVFILIVIAGIFLSSYLLMYGAVNWTCGSYEEVTGKPTKVAALDCYIKDGDNWYVWEEYKHRLITKGEIK